jgi:methionyl-tRNA formyltransferase
MTGSHDEGLEDWIRAQNPDVIVVFSMSQLLKENIFNIPKFGTINIHPSYLPEYRGPAPDIWQYYNMEINPGVTVHYIDSGEDTGDIIFQERTPILLGKKLPDKLDKLIGRTGVNLILKALNAIQEGNAPRVTQSKESPTLRARNLKPGEYNQLINWENWPIEHVWHVLRGTEHWLNELHQPKGFYKCQSWIVEDYERCDISGYKIGEVYRGAGKWFVICKEGKIYLSLKFDLKNLLIGLIR